MDDLGVK
jgi:LEM3 (ligand-effect modulator 3) family / CDC50 family